MVSKSGFFAVTILWLAFAQTPDEAFSQGHRRSKHHHHHGGKTVVGVSPHGISVGYFDDNFGIAIGPLFGHDLGPRHYFDPPPVIERSGLSHSVSPPATGFGPQYGYGRKPASHGVSPESRVLLIPASPAARSWQIEAERAFRERRYGDALRLTRHASLEDNQNGMLYLFASHAAFAAAEFDQAYGLLVRGLELLEDPDQWGFVIENYQQLYSNSDYVKQMETLNAFSEENPDLGQLRTIRAFHYLHLGFPDAARTDLKNALSQNPDDDAAMRLMATIQREPLPEPAQAVAPTPPPSLDPH